MERGDEMDHFIVNEGDGVWMARAIPVLESKKAAGFAFWKLVGEPGPKSVRVFLFLI